MSHNQSRADRSEYNAQYRKTGRSSGGSNQQRSFSGGVSAKGGGGATSNRSSFKKYNSTAQGGQSSTRSPNVDSSDLSAARDVRNGAQQEQLITRVPETAVTGTSSNVRLTDAPVQKVTQAVPGAPSSNLSSAAQPSNVSSNSESMAPTTPAKVAGDASKSFPLQFGSISPGFVNGMQIPPRTSSAPPNLDEQKKNQARRDSIRAAPAVPIPSVPKQQLPKKDGGILDQPKAGEAQTGSKPKRDAQVSAAPLVAQTQKPSLHHIPGMPMQLPFHQPQVPVQFGGPSPQIQSQAMVGTSLPMPMPIPMPMSLPLGNPSVPHSMFVPGLQPHPMQSQGMMHQGQGLNFSSQMGHQLPPQLGNMGMNIAPQFPQQSPVMYSGSRKTVKITHPDTHEELRLDSSPAPRSHASVPPQSQPIASFPPNISMNFYPNSYNSPSPFFPAASSVPLNSTQAPPTAQPPRSFSQVSVKPPVGSHGEKEALRPTSASSVGKTESVKSSKLHGEDLARHQKEIGPSSLSSLPQSKPASISTSAALSGPVSVERDVTHTSAAASASVYGSASTSIRSVDEANIGEADSVKDKHKNIGNGSQQDQDDGLSTSLSGLPSQLPVSQAVEAKSTKDETNLVTGTPKESLSAAVSCEASNLTEEVAMETKTGDSSENLGTKGTHDRQLKPEVTGGKKHGEAILSDRSGPSKHSSDSESPGITSKIDESSVQDVTSTSGGLLVYSQEKFKESSGYSSKDVKMDKNNLVSTQASDGVNASSTGVSEEHPHEEQESASAMVPSPTDEAPGPENEGADNNTGGIISPSASSVKDKVLLDTNVAKVAVPRGKKKKKELYKKAEAAGTSSDLYMAYKGPDEKKEAAPSAKGLDNTSSVTVQEPVSEPQVNAVPREKPALGKVEPDDWEDAAEISTPKLETSKNENQDFDGVVDGITTKRYSRDFLLKFVEQCTDLPEGFEITSDIADALMISGVNVSRESYPSPGRNIDGAGGVPRMDRRGSGLGDEEKWSKFPVPVMSGRGDMRSDMGYGVNIGGFRPGQGGNYGVLRNPRAQTPVQYAGGILSGPMQSLGPQGALQRNNSDSDRWQRGTGFQKGLMPSPQTPMPVMHKAEKKYEIGKVTDEEQAKQRLLKGILNKLTPQNFEKLFQQVKQVNIDNVVTLSGVIAQIFDKALLEPTFCEMYANFCFHLAKDLPMLIVDNQKITFKRLLLNKCQEEFERGEREEEEANKADEEGEVKLTADEREEKRLRVRRRMLGNIRLIGELYKKRMLTERIMHECINKLLGQYQNPDEENIEALCKLMSTIGEMIDHPRAKEHMDAYFDIMSQLSNNMKLSSRVRFMLKDAIDLRKNKWQQRRKVEGPKKIEEVHRDAAQERHAQASRLARGPSMGNSVRRGPPMEYAPRSPSMLSAPSPQIGGYRAVPPQARGYGSQDARVDERHSFENRTMSVPLPQRPFGESSITLGPQGGLARGMALRGQSSTPSFPMEMPSPGDVRRAGPGPNGFPVPERAAYSQREDLVPRYATERFSAAPVYDQPHPQERGISYDRNTDRGFDRSLPTSPSARGGLPSGTENVTSEKVWPEEYLRDKSLATIKEFYSARDENEVALCIKDLNTPSFYPSMISVWVTDSFERKDWERDLLTKLLINLTKPRDAIITQDQLIKGFESVLEVLEDAVNDAPKAAEFLGRIFAKVILDHVISLNEIGRLIHEGGEERGRLVEIGIAAEVLGSVLDIIKSEEGDSVLNEIRSSSNLRLEIFRPPGSNKSWRIDKFI